MGTIPSPNPIPNSANVTFNYIVDPSLGTTGSGNANSNSVNSQVNNAFLDNITKSIDKPFADVGYTLTYNVAITNTGNTTANNVLFKDTIPNGTSIVSGSLALNGSPIPGDPNPPGVNIGAIPAGSTATVSFKVVVNTIPSPNPIPNSANTTFSFIVDPTLGTTNTGSSNSNIITSQVNHANLGNINKSTDKYFADVGTTITYTVTITNTGSTNANNVMFIDTIPNGTSIVSGSLTLNGSPIPGNPNPPGVNIGTITPGTTSTVTFKVVVYTLPSPNPITNSASTNFNYIVDPTLGTTGTGSSNSNKTTSKVNNANLNNFLKTTDKPFADIGTTITYTAVITNTGSTNANSVMFIDTIPNGTTLVANSLTLNGAPIFGNPNPPGLNIGTIMPGLTSTVSFKVVVYTIPSPNPIINNASTTFNYIVDPTLGTTANGGSNSNNTTSQVNHANLSNFTKTSDSPFTDVGSTITYTAVITNTGTANANSVMFIDTIPSGTSIVTGSLTLNGSPLSGNPNPPGVNIGIIPVASTSTVTFQVVVNTIPSPNPIPNSASTTFSYIVDPTLGTTANGSSNSTTTTSKVNNANLSNFFKTSDKPFADIGTTITYTATITNSGTVNANNVMFIDTIPVGTTIVPGSLTLNGSPIFGDPNPPGANIGVIPAGSTYAVSFKVLVETLPSPNPISNSASTTFNYIVDPTLGTTNTGSSNSTTTTSKINHANLSSFFKTSDTPFADIGTTITYTATIANTGSANANNVMFIDTIPVGTTIVPGSLTLNGTPIAGNPNPPGVNIGIIPAGSTSTVMFKVLVYTLPSPNPISNSASTNFSYVVDPTLGTTATSGSNSNNTTSQVNHADLSKMIKTSDKDFAGLGNTITYSVAITNTGSTNANNVMLIDTIPANTSIVAGTLTLNGAPLFGDPNPPGVNIGVIPVGSTSTVSFQVLVNTVPSPNPMINSASTTYNYIVDPTLGTTATGGYNSNGAATKINYANLNNILKTADKDYADVDDTLTYTVNIKNTGNTAANNVMFIDTIPNQTSLVPGSLTLNGAPIIGDPNPPGANIGSIAAGTTATVSFKVVVNTVPSPNPISNSASTTFNYLVDPTLGTTTTGSSNSNTTSTQINHADLRDIAKVVDKQYGDLGYVLTYTVAMTNTGNVTANSIVFKDTIPNGTSIVDGSFTVNGIPVAGSPNPPGVNIGEMAPGATSTVSFQVIVNTLPCPNPIPNSANATFSYLVNPLLSNTFSLNQVFMDALNIDPSGNATASVNSNIVNTQINHVDFGTSTGGGSVNGGNAQFITFGQPLQYCIGVANSGSTTALNVVFIDTIPNGASLVPDSFTDCSGITIPGANPDAPGVNLGSIPPFSTCTVCYKINFDTLPSPNPVVNSAYITAQYVVDPILGTLQTTSFNTPPIVTQVNVANLVETTKSVNATTVVVGDVFAYTVTLTNTGNVTASNIVFIDTVPTGTSLIDGSFRLNGTPLGGSPNPPGVNIGSIGPNSTFTVSYAVVINELHAPNTITNSASTTYSFIVDPTLGTTSNGNSNSNVLNNGFLPLDYTAVGSFNQSYVTPCGKIMYSLTITNTEDTPIQNLIVNIMDQGAEYDNLGVTINGTVFKNINPNKPNNINAFRPDLFPLAKGSSVTISYYAIAMKSCYWENIQFNANITAEYNIYGRNVIVSKTSNTATANILSMWNYLNLSTGINLDCEQPDINNVLNSRSWVELVDYKVMKTPVSSLPNAEGLSITGRQILIIGVLKSKILYGSNNCEDQVINLYREKMFSILVTADPNTMMNQKFNVVLSIDNEELSVTNPRQLFQNIQISGLVK